MKLNNANIKILIFISLGLFFINIERINANTTNNNNKNIKVGMIFSPNKIKFGLDSLNEEISDRIAYHIFDNILQIGMEIAV